MADDNFRSNTSRSGWMRSEATREAAHDPLAELARLIGQGDPYAERGARRPVDEPGPAFDWAANQESTQDYANERGHAEEHFAPPPLPPASYPSYAQDDQDYAEEPPAAGRYFSGSAGKFNGFGADADGYGPQDQAPVSAPRSLPAFMSALPDGSYEERAQEAGEDYGDYSDDYYEEPPSPRRRGGLIVMMAVLGLVIVGTAGAFAYRTMFGSAVFASLPPIIKANIAPNKIVPNNADSQADKLAQAGAPSQASSEKLVSREEQPVNMEPPKTASRVVATIPIGSAQMSPPPVVTAAPAPTTPNASAAAFSNVSTTATLAPPPDSTPPAPPPMPTPAAASAPAPATAEPKKVRTVLIHADQSGATAALPAPAPPAAAPAPRSTRSAAAKASASAAPAPVGANAPLSIVPGSDDQAVAPTPVAPAPAASAPARSRAAAESAPVALASAEPGESVAAASVASGGYAVQVTSQQSEADAKASFKELRAKFPNQLGGREPIIRRADLGAKGVYYRAMVGPFASMEEAAGVCSSLKAAGGNCLVQRN